MTPTKIKEEVRAKIIEANPDIEGRNTSMRLEGIFTGLINYRDSNICLTDVLLAIKKESPPFPQEIILGAEEPRKIIGMWNLKETYDNQSPELYQFLHNILCKTK